MRSKNHMRLTSFCLLASSLLLLLPASVLPQTTLTISPSSASVGFGGTEQFIATPNGVSWSLQVQYCLGNCTLGGHWVTSPCYRGCGSVSPVSTPSGIPTTYTAPLTPYQFPSGARFTSIFLVATRSGGYAAKARIGLVQISVSVSPPTAGVSLNASSLFTATVMYDATNSGVTWTLTQNGVACSPGCGTISPARTASGAAATYVAPTTAPVLPVVTVTASSVKDNTRSSIPSGTVTLTTSTGALPCSAGSGSEAMFKGQYAFLLQEFHGISVAGSITADGTGKITGEEEDIQYNAGYGKVPPTLIPAESSYAVGPDHRGCLLLTGTNGEYGEARFFLFALGSMNSSGTATAGRVIEVYDSSATGTHAAGILRLQDPTSFVASQFKGNYAFGVVGRPPSTALAGTFAFDGISAITSGNLDMNVGGVVTTDISSSGSFTCCSPNGRGTGQFSIPNPVGGTAFAFYMINSGDVILLVGGTGGEAIRIPPGTTFAQSSLHGAAVLHETAQSNSGPIVDVATASSNGTGALTVNDNINSGGTFTASSTALNYVVASNGRVAVTGGASPPILYLFGQNQGFLLGTDSDVTFGTMEPQAAGSFSDGFFSGAYVFGTENPSELADIFESGVATADGKGSAAGTLDQSSSAGFAPNQSLNFAYSLSASGTGNVGNGTTAILISGKKLVFINNTSTTPTITVVEK